MFQVDDVRQAECVLVDAVVEFSTTNVSTDTVCWDAKIGLPNPIHPGLKRLVGVTDIRLTKGGEPIHVDRASADEKFRQVLEADSTTSVPFEAASVSLEPGENCEFFARYVMAKESEDTELLQTMVPTNGLRVTIFDQASDGRRLIFARSVHRQKLESVPSAETPNQAKIFTIPGYLLPHQGVLIWWKRNPDALIVH
jgi:hypothetical protein